MRYSGQLTRLVNFAPGGNTMTDAAELIGSYLESKGYTSN